MENYVNHESVKSKLPVRQILNFKNKECDI